MANFKYHCGVARIHLYGYVSVSKIKICEKQNTWAWYKKVKKTFFCYFSKNDSSQNFFNYFSHEKELQK